MGAMEGDAKPSTAAHSVFELPRSGNDLFDKVVEESGLSTLIAHAAITRACNRAGVDPHLLDRVSLTRVLPHLEMTLRLYIPDEAETRLHSLRQLAR
jgi:hypothetical protein